MNYLKYIEHAAENLQFFLWHKDYTRRFNELPESERKLSPEWTMTQAEQDAFAAGVATRPKNLSPDVAAVFKGTDFANGPTVSESEKRFDPFDTPPRTPSQETKRDDDMSFVSSQRPSVSQYTKSTTNYTRKAEGAFDDAGLKWQPCSSHHLYYLTKHSLSPY